MRTRPVYLIGAGRRFFGWHGTARRSRRAGSSRRRRNAREADPFSCDGRARCREMTPARKLLSWRLPGRRWTATGRRPCETSGAAHALTPGVKTRIVPLAVLVRLRRARPPPTNPSAAASGSSTAPCRSRSSRRSAASPHRGRASTEDVLARNRNTGLMMKVGETTTETWTYDRGAAGRADGRDHRRRHASRASTGSR